MKKFLLLILVSSIFGINNADAVMSNQAMLDKIEKSLFGYQYSDENNAKRLVRIELSVYGKISQKSENERISKLNKDISADMIGQEITPVEDTFAEYPEYLEEDLKETPDVSYPVVDALEQEVFKAINKKDDIKTRLSKLEQKTFKKTYNDDLSTRVDRLRAELKPNVPEENRLADSNVFFDDTPAPKDYHLNKIMPSTGFDYDTYKDMDSMFERSYNTTPMTSGGFRTSKPRKTSLSSVEKGLFKASFPNESMETRLARIEKSMFGTEFSSDDAQTRLDRVSSAYRAEKSAGKYDSNRFSQNLATAMQIGTIILMVLACIL
jgi:hypothetical protein